MNNFSIRDFLLGIATTTLILVPIFFSYILPHHYQGIKADQALLQKQIDMILEQQPEFFETMRYLGKMIEEFKIDMNERTKLITQDMWSETEIEPDEND